MIVLFSARRSEMMVPGARCALLVFELSAGVAAADKADRSRSSAWKDGRILCLVQLLANVLDALGD